MPDKFLPPPIFAAASELQLHGTPNKRVEDAKLTKGGCRSGDSTPTSLTTSWSLPNQLANHLCPACPEEVGPLVPEDPGSDSAWETWSSLGSSSSSGANSSGSTTDALSGCAWTEALTPCSAECHRSYHRLWGVPEHHCSSCITLWTSQLKPRSWQLLVEASKLCRSDGTAALVQCQLLASERSCGM